MPDMKPQEQADRLARLRRQAEVLRPQGQPGEGSAEAELDDRAALRGTTWSALPGWTWAFILACGAIPALNVYLHGPYGAGAWGVGLFGASVCAAAAKRSDWSRFRRAAACVGVTALVWGVFGLVVLAEAVAYDR
jgi:hypothetical protein